MDVTNLREIDDGAKDGEVKRLYWRDETWGWVSVLGRWVSVHPVLGGNEGGWELYGAMGGEPTHYEDVEDVKGRTVSPEPS